MATVNDFTHTWHGSTPPPLPPYRQQPLSPEEEARFHRDEMLSMLPGARSWASVANVEGDSAAEPEKSVLPRVLFNMFSGRMPVLAVFQSGLPCPPITNEPEYWTYFKPRPADDPAPHEKAHWERIRAWWRVRMAHPELKCGRLITGAIDAGDAAVFAFLREKDGHISAVLINFRGRDVTCRLRINWAAAGLVRPTGGSGPIDLLRGGAPVDVCDEDMSDGWNVAIPPRDGVVLKLAAPI
jgi:hypothetical protein